VFDLGSAAGSWINFEEIPPQGAPLKDGDRLNFGRAAFRVRLKPSPENCEGNRPADREGIDEG
jgi:predicted component of type VI protein secretion system